MESDQTYYARRAATEQIAAAAAQSDQARSVHQELAKRYVALATKPGNVISIRRSRTRGWVDTGFLESRSAAAKRGK